MREHNAVVGLLTGLLDFSFGTLITIKLTRVLYIAGAIGLALFYLLLIGLGFSRGVGAGFAMMISTPLLYILSLIVLRVFCESISVVFRIAENVEAIARGGRASASSSHQPEAE